jgi:hypothetical protein
VKHKSLRRVNFVPFVFCGERDVHQTEAFANRVTHARTLALNSWPEMGSPRVLEETGGFRGADAWSGTALMDRRAVPETCITFENMRETYTGYIDLDQPMLVHAQMRQSRDQQFSIIS